MSEPHAAHTALKKAHSDLQVENTELQHQKEIAESESRVLREVCEELEILFANAPIGILFAYNGVIARANPLAADLLAYSGGPEAMLGMPSVRLFESDADYAAFGAAVVPGLIRDETVFVHWRLQRRDATSVMVRMTGRPLPSTRYQRGAIWMLEDITDELRIEDELRLHREHLEQLVDERTAELQKSNLLLTESNRRLEEAHVQLVQTEKLSALGSLVAGIAHELNTPIGNSVTVASTLHHSAQQMFHDLREGKLRKSTFEQTLSDTVGGADVLMRNLRRAAELISSFKQVAVDQTSNQRRHFDLKMMLDDLRLALAPMYGKTPFALQMELVGDIQMDSYPGAMSQVFTNLISNALAHGFEGRSQGRMHLQGRLINGARVELRFSDDGIGIPKAHLKSVFDPFFTTKLGRGGSGLGMNIVYNLVTGVLGGQVTLDSTVDEGTTITLTLPLTAPVKSQT